MYAIMFIATAERDRSRRKEERRESMPV